MNGRRQRRAVAIIAALVTLLIVMLTAAALLRAMLVVHRQSRAFHRELQAQWLAEAALSRAAARLASDPEYTGETWQPQVGPADEPSGRVTIAVSRPAGRPQQRLIAARAEYPEHESQRSTIHRELSITILPPEPTAGEHKP
jgi:type II secretory pathway component PulK